MCTAITLNTKDHYFGRNLDLEYSYNEAITITPRSFIFKFRHVPNVKKHYAIIGISTIDEDYPLYYDAVNEKGLAMAGLNFPDNARYLPINADKDNIAPFEFIPWILTQCSSVNEAEEYINRINLAEICFNEKFPISPLHWIISDKHSSIVVEPLKDGVHIYKNSIGVLTNNPTFDIQLFNLNNYMQISNKNPNNNFSDQISLSCYSRGMGGLGLPGDWSSASRFVKAAFLKLNSVCDDNNGKSVNQFFHILDSVAHPRGCVKVKNKNEITVYSSCTNTDKGIYYYKTYENSRITAVDMFKENLDDDKLVSYPLLNSQDIYHQN